jgi:hypothetical protein
MNTQIHREKLKLTSEEAQHILYDDVDPPEFKIIEDKMVDKSRWSIQYRLVVQRLADGKFFADYYQRGATEYQDQQPWEFDKPNFTEVFPVEKTITVYK